MPGNTEVQFQTPQGNFVIELFADVPLTVANFLYYVANDRYDGSFFHRLVKGFVLQGGGFTYDGTTVGTIATQAPVINEYSANHPNALGTISMARTTDLNSGTSQFFFNVVNNSADLVNYAVFGQVIQGWDVITAITGLNVVNAGSPFETLPVEPSFTGGMVKGQDVVSFHVEALGVANDDLASTGEAVVTTGSLVTNDVDVDTPVLAIATVNGQAAKVGSQFALASGALLTVNANGTYSYDPNHAFDALNAGQTGNDSFTYTLVGGGTVSGSATVRITINGAGEAGEHLVGTTGPDVLTGGAGDDVLEGLDGNDTLDGGIGNDSLYGGSGDDIVNVDAQGDLVFENEGEGTDTVVSAASFYLYANIENLTLAAGAGDIFGVGNGLANVMTGNEGANTLLAGAGIDTVHGGGGVDIVYGEDGNDVLFGDAGNDVLVGGIGNDAMDGGDGGDSLYGEDGNDTLTGGTDFVFDQLVGGAGNDVLHGDSGLGDFDYLFGNTGDDIFYVDTFADLVFENAGEGTDTVYADINGTGYYLYGNIENLILLDDTPFGVGNELANNLTGSASGNYLLGGAGNDILNGKAGNDVLFGEAGADTFVFEHGTGGDTIGDFAAGTDKIDLTAFGFTSFAQVQAAMSETGGTTAIILGGGDFIVLNGVANAALHAGDFILLGTSSEATQPAQRAQTDVAGDGEALARGNLIHQFDAPGLFLHIDGFGTYVF